MNVLSLFDGMSCGQIALDRLGIQVDNYFASEVDKYAIQVTKTNFKNTVHVGDVTKINYLGGELYTENGIFNTGGAIDLLVGGSPCQGFSFAGKQLNFEDPRSKLFFEFVRLKNELNPKYFLLENVKMKREYQDVITECLGVQPILINSALVSAQNRKRLYWTNIPSSQLVDRNIFLKDILESEVDEKYFLSEKGLDGMVLHKKKNESKGNGFGVQFIDEGTEKANTLLQRYYKDCKDNAYCVASRGRNPENPTSRKAGLPTVQMLEAREDVKTNCLTSVQKDNLVQIGNIYNNKHNSVAGRVYTDEGKSVTLSALGGGGGAKTGLYKMNTGIRRLTPIECERLQTVPDNYTSSVSDTQRYRMLGNGWTVDVIVHIFNNLPYF